MGKTYLVAAITGALATPVAVQADVTIYGIAHISIDALDNDGPGLNALGQPVINEDGAFVSSNDSRIGFKGNEDLGGGLRAIWQIETEVRLDEGGEEDDGTEFADRNSFLGLEGGWGALLAGRHDTPFRIVSRSVDLFDEQIGDSRNILRNNGVNATVSMPGSVGFDERPGNIVAYVSPSLKGAQGMLLYSVEDGLDEGDLTSANVTYSRGPLWAGVAYEVHGEALAGGGEEENGWRLGASYGLGLLKVTALYQQLKELGGVSGADRDAWGVGGAYSRGRNVLKAQWYGADELDTLSDSGADMWVVGIDHNFSRRTTGYVAYAQTDNDAGAAFSMAGEGRGDEVTPPLGGDPSGFSLGLVHQF